MEWVRVSFPRTRDVFVDGRRSGETNRLLIVSRGRHEFHLGLPENYSPRRNRTTVMGTSETTPQEIDFLEGTP
jgi:hypothetical protein